MDSERAAIDGLSRRNGVAIVPAFEALLRENHLDSIDTLFSNTIGERLDKPGLPTWRERWRVTLRDPAEPPFCEGRTTPPSPPFVRGGVTPPEPPLCKGRATPPNPPFARGGAGSRTFYLKRFTNPPASARREVRRSGTGAKSVAGLEWTWMNRLARDGIPCACPVALAEELRGSREVRSAILTAAVPGDSLEHWAARWTRADHATIRALIGVLAKLVARLHAAGYVHRDLYLSHLFFDPAAPLDDALCLIDLQRMIRPAANPRRWIVKDLAALNYSAPTARDDAASFPSPTRGDATGPSDLISQADRLRWLKLYLGAVKLDGSARRLAYRVIGKTMRIQSRAARRRLREHIR